MTYAVPATALDDVADLIATRLGLDDRRPLGRGGSGAQTFVGTSREHGSLVVKLVRAQPDAVDGHDLASFRRKQRQVAHLREIAPDIGALYPELVAEIDGGDWAATAHRYVQGTDLVEYSRRVGHLPAHRHLRTLWEHLGRHGYRPGSGVASETTWETMFVERITRRWWLLDRCLPAELLESRDLSVNGVTVAGFRRALGFLAEFAGQLGPLWVAAPVHGDLNLRNIIVADGGPDADTSSMSLIDPRGTAERWSPVYDLAKILFTVTLFESVMADEVQVDRVAPGEFAMVRRSSELDDWVQLLCREGVDMLTAAGVDPHHGAAQVLFAHATHVLAESACRLSDRGQEPPVRRARSEALLLAGLVAVQRLRELEGNGVLTSGSHELTPEGLVPVMGR